MESYFNSRWMKDGGQFGPAEGFITFAGYEKGGFIRRDDEGGECSHGYIIFWSPYGKRICDATIVYDVYNGEFPSADWFLQKSDRNLKKGSGCLN